MEYNRKIAVLIYKSGKKSGYLLSKFNHFFNDFFNHFCRWAQQLLKLRLHTVAPKKSYENPVIPFCEYLYLRFWITTSISKTVL